MKTSAYSYLIGKDKKSIIEDLDQSLIIIIQKSGLIILEKIGQAENFTCLLFLKMIQFKKLKYAKTEYQLSANFQGYSRHEIS